MICETREQAIKEGQKVLKIVNGKGWKIYVHENIGWHTYLVNNGLTLAWYFHRMKKIFYIFLGTKYAPGCGEAILMQSGRYGSNPNKVVKEAIQYGRKVVNEYNNAITKIEKNLKEK